MKFTRELASTMLVRRVEHDGISIADRTWTEIVALTPDAVIDNWCQKSLADIAVEDLEPVLEKSPEIILYGCGEKGALPPRELMFAMARRGVGFEVMDTAAAARTFNVLAGEGRPVAAILTPQCFHSDTSGPLDKKGNVQRARQVPRQGG